MLLSRLRQWHNEKNLIVKDIQCCSLPSNNNNPNHSILHRERTSSFTSSSDLWILLLRPWICRSCTTATVTISFEILDQGISALLDSWEINTPKSLLLSNISNAEIRFHSIIFYYLFFSVTYYLCSRIIYHTTAKLMMILVDNFYFCFCFCLFPVAEIQGKCFLFLVDYIHALITDSIWIIS